VKTVKKMEVFEGVLSGGNEEGCKAKIWSRRTGKVIRGSNTT
jgi:hypothetical protein